MNSTVVRDLRHYADSFPLLVATHDMRVSCGGQAESSYHAEVCASGVARLLIALLTFTYFYFLSYFSI